MGSGVFLQNYDGLLVQSIGRLIPSLEVTIRQRKHVIWPSVLAKYRSRLLDTFPEFHNCFNTASAYCLPWLKTSHDDTGLQDTSSSSSFPPFTQDISVPPETGVASRGCWAWMPLPGCWSPEHFLDCPGLSCSNHLPRHIVPSRQHVDHHERGLEGIIKHSLPT